MQKHYKVQSEKSPSHFGSPQTQFLLPLYNYNYYESPTHPSGFPTRDKPFLLGNKGGIPRLGLGAVA